MIIVETLEGGRRERRYSDQGMKLLQVQTGNKYDDAVDVVPCKYDYTETDEPVDEEEPLEAQEALDMIFGGGDGSV